MALDPTEGHGLTNELANLYTAAELTLLAALAALLIEGITDDNWATRQTEQTLRMRRVAEELVAHLNTAAPQLIEDAVRKASLRGARAADQDLDDAGVTHDDAPRVTSASPGVAGATAAATRATAATGAGATAASERLHPRTRTAINDAWTTLARVNQTLPGVAGAMYQQAVAEIQVRDRAVSRTTPHTGGVMGAPRATGTRLDAAQQALDILTARGVTGFRDSRGRNWNLTSYIEMASRTIVNQELINSHTARMLERGQTLLVVSSHANSAPQCQPFEGQVLSLDGETGTVERESATTGRTVQVRIKATLAEARSKGFQHPNCGHAVSAFIPGASRTFTTKPDPDGYAATQQQRYLERQIRDAKYKAAGAVTEDAKRTQAARIRAYQKKLREHTNETGLMRRPRREQIGRAI